MDEPFGALDPLTRGEMQGMLVDLLGRVRKTVLVVTHDLNEALILARRVVFLEGGVVVADLAAGEVERSENEHVRRYVEAVRGPMCGRGVRHDADFCGCMGRRSGGLRLSIFG